MLPITMTAIEAITSPLMVPAPNPKDNKNSIADNSSYFIIITARNNPVKITIGKITGESSAIRQRPSPNPINIIDDNMS